MSEYKKFARAAVRDLLIHKPNHVVREYCRRINACDTEQKISDVMREVRYAI